MGSWYVSGEEGCVCPSTFGC